MAENKEEIYVKKDKINAQNYMKRSKKRMKKCLNLCGKAIHIPGLTDGRVKFEEKVAYFLSVKIIIFVQFLTTKLQQKAIPSCKKCFALWMTSSVGR